MLAVAALGAGLLALRDAEAAPSARLVYLRNPGAESCPDEQAIRAAVAARLGYDPFFPYAPTTLFAEISKTERGFSARVKLVDDKNTVRGSRELTQAGEACAEIIDTMALSISIAIDPHSLERPAGVPPPPEPASAPEPAASPPPEPAHAEPEPARASEPERPEPAAPADKAIHLEAGFSPALSLGAAPSASAGASLFARARRSAYSLGLEGRYDLPASRAVGAATVETSLLAAALVPCFHVGVLSLCAVGALGSIHATSRGVRSPKDDAGLHALVGPRAALEVPLVERLTLRTHIEGLFTLTPQSLELDGTSIYTLPRASFGAGIGLVLRFF